MIKERAAGRDYQTRRIRQRGEIAKNRNLE
jgi:hypothetical protein